MNRTYLYVPFVCVYCERGHISDEVYREIIISNIRAMDDADTIRLNPLEGRICLNGVQGSEP